MAGQGRCSHPGCSCTVQEPHAVLQRGLAVLQRRLCGRAGLRARRLQLQPARSHADAQRLMDPGVHAAALRAAHASGFPRAWSDTRAGARKANLEWQ